MRIVKNFAAAAAALMLAVSLAGCQLVDQVINDAAQQAEQGQNQSAPQGAGTAAKLIRVVDGDTIAVQPDANFAATNDSGTEHVVRLLSIDTPEMNKMSDAPAECGAQEALDHLTQLLASSTDITIVFDANADRTDRYGRSLAYVELVDGTDVALSMARDGFAEAWYPQGEPEPERFASYSAAEQVAQDSDAGAHASCDTIGR